MERYLQSYEMHELATCSLYQTNYNVIEEGEWYVLLEDFWSFVEFI